MLQGKPSIEELLVGGTSMRLIRKYGAIKDEGRGCVATIGNFDGVHRGHQDILAQLHARAKKEGVKDCVIVVEPLPREYFARQTESGTSPARIQTFRDKLEALTQNGVGQVLRLSFNDALRNRNWALII